MRRLWNGRVDQWSDTVATSPAFARLRQRMLDLAAPTAADRCLDLGAGAGFLTLPLATRVASVLAVDLSPAMLESLRDQAAQVTGTVTTQSADMARLDLPAASFDLIMSSYAMHYLVDEDKTALLLRMWDWLTPGGRVVISDMMLGRSLDRHHRQVLADKARAMLCRGPSGWWRLLKNIVRIGSGRGRLHPCAPEWWTQALQAAQYTAVRYEHVSSEAGIVVGTRPE